MVFLAKYLNPLGLNKGGKLMNLLKQFNETLKQLPYLTDNVISNVKQTWTGTEREYALKILAALKNLILQQEYLVVTSKPDLHVDLDSFEISFEYSECNCTAGVLSDLDEYVDNLLKEINILSPYIKFHRANQGSTDSCRALILISWYFLNFLELLNIAPGTLH